MASVFFFPEKLDDLARKPNYFNGRMIHNTLNLEMSITERLMTLGVDDTWE